MRVYHNTRELAYRKPYGAGEVGRPVSFTLDVYDSPGAKAVLRTWTDGEGEGLFDMQALESAPESGCEAQEPVQFQVTYTPKTAGIVWYQFRITDAEGFIWFYGAMNGRVGGEGQLVGWEPPSFQLSVFDADAMPPMWHEPINGYLHDPAARHDPIEVIETTLENYPAWACRTVSPWIFEDARPELQDAVLPTMEDALKRIQYDAPTWFSVNGDVFGFWCESDGGAPSCALFNASPATAYDVPVPMMGDAVAELVGGYGVNVVGASEAGELRAFVPTTDRYALVHLWQFGSSILQFHAQERLAAPMEEGLGVLAHITSLPMEGGECGTLGAPARAFVDWLAQAGVRYWQVLPVNPTDEYASPYAGISAFAGNTRLLEGAGQALGGDAFESEGYRLFCEREAAWLEPYACFMAIREAMGEGMPWQKWPRKYRRYNAALVEGDASLSERAEACRRLQYAFEQQWKDLRAYANGRGVQIIGDIPIYVSADSADVWAHPELFQLGKDGNPDLVAGCPPDAFAVDGQKWGNPVYDWDAMEADGYDWWIRRLRRVFELYDYVRLDHFIGFSRYFSIPVDEKASAGTFRLGPGYDFFRRAHETLGPLPIIAEDLGLITPRVRSLVADCGFYGMDIMQFVDGNDPLAGYVPRPDKIVYTGTHDNHTLVGYICSRYPEADETSVVDELIEKAVTCDAPVCILPLQDVLRLDDEARMNVPGVAEGNWAWQADAADIAAASELLSKFVQLNLG